MAKGEGGPLYTWVKLPENRNLRRLAVEYERVLKYFIKEGAVEPVSHYRSSKAAPAKRGRIARASNPARRKK